MKFLMRHPITILLLILADLVIASPARATDIHLLWDASTTSNVTYRIYATTNIMSSTNLNASQVKVDVGTNQSVTLHDMKPAIWTFAATAVKATLSTNATLLVVGSPSVTTNYAESDPSNFLGLEIPERPARMRTLIPQANATLTGTNWIDTGFFRLKIE